MINKMKKVSYAAVDKFHDALCPLKDCKYNNPKFRCYYDYTHSSAILENQMWEKYVDMLSEYALVHGKDLDYVYRVITSPDPETLTEEETIFRENCLDLWYEVSYMY